MILYFVKLNLIYFQTYFRLGNILYIFILDLETVIMCIKKSVGQKFHENVKLNTLKRFCVYRYVNVTVEKEGKFKKKKTFYKIYVKELFMDSTITISLLLHGSFVRVEFI